MDAFFSHFNNNIDHLNLPGVGLLEAVLALEEYINYDSKEHDEDTSKPSFSS
jgi:hypothetical protein